MSEGYLTYQRFNTSEQAQWLLNVLEKYSISYKLEDTPLSLESGFVNNPLHNEICVKLAQADFERVNALLLEEARAENEPLEGDHYLNTFSDEELKEILQKPDEWNPADFLHAQELLTSRGITVTGEQLNTWKAQRLAFLRKPDKVHTGWLVFGLLLSVAGGLLGIFLGWHYMNFKKTDPTGERFYAYDEETRKAGKSILWVGVFFFAMLTTIRIFTL